MSTSEQKVFEKNLWDKGKVAVSGASRYVKPMVQGNFSNLTTLHCISGTISQSISTQQPNIDPLTLVVHRPLGFAAGKKCGS